MTYKDESRFVFGFRPHFLSGANKGSPRANCFFLVAAFMVPQGRVVLVVLPPYSKVNRLVWVPDIKASQGLAAN